MVEALSIRADPSTDDTLFIHLCHQILVASGPNSAGIAKKALLHYVHQLEWQMEELSIVVVSLARRCSDKEALSILVSLVKELLDAIGNPFAGALVEKLKQTVNESPWINCHTTIELANILLLRVVESDSADEKLVGDLISVQSFLFGDCLRVHRRRLRMSACKHMRSTLHDVLHSKHSKLAFQLYLNSTANPNISLGTILLVATLIKTIYHASSTEILFLNSGMASKGAALANLFMDYIVSGKLHCPTNLFSVAGYLLLYASQQQIEAELLPGMEKALLRSPLTSLKTIPSLFAALRLDEVECGSAFSSFFATYLGTFRSSNNQVRHEAEKCFNIIEQLPRPYVWHAFECVIESLNKTQLSTSSINQRMIHYRFLQHFPPFITSAAVLNIMRLLKNERNDLVISSAINTFAKYVTYFDLNDLESKIDLGSIFVNGFADSRTIVRTAWMEGMGRIIECIPYTNCSSVLEPLLSVCLPKLYDVFSDHMRQPMHGLQKGSLRQAYIALTLILVSSAKFENKITLSKTSNSCFATDVIELSKKCTELIISSSQHTSILFSDKIHFKLVEEADIYWLFKCLQAVATTGDSNFSVNIRKLWFRPFLYFLTDKRSLRTWKKYALDSLTAAFSLAPSRVSAYVHCGYNSGYGIPVITSGLKAISNSLNIRLNFIHLPLLIIFPRGPINGLDLEKQLLENFMLAHNSMFSGRISWIDLCRRVGQDPGRIVGNNVQQLMSLIKYMDQTTKLEDVVRAAGTLALVAPQIFNPMLCDIFETGLSSQLFCNLSSLDIEIWKSDGTFPVVDVLKLRKPTQSTSAEEEWDAEVRAEIAKRKGISEFSYTPEIQDLINERLKKEDFIRKEVALVHKSLLRATSIINELSAAPRLHTELWYPRAVASLLSALQNRAFELDPIAIVDSIQSCSVFVDLDSPILSELLSKVIILSYRPKFLFRDMPICSIEDATSRLMYSLNERNFASSGNQMSAVYALQLPIRILDQGGVSTSTEANEEQQILSLRILKKNAELFQSSCFPRDLCLRALLTSLSQSGTTVFTEAKHVLILFAEILASSASQSEINILLEAMLSTDVHVRKAVLQAAESFDFSDQRFPSPLWICCCDSDEDNAITASAIWKSNDIKLKYEDMLYLLDYLSDSRDFVRFTAAKSIAQFSYHFVEQIPATLDKLYILYHERNKDMLPQYDDIGFLVKSNVERKDYADTRKAVGQTIYYMAPVLTDMAFDSLVYFLFEEISLADRSESVRDMMLNAAKRAVNKIGNEKALNTMTVFSKYLKRESAEVDVHIHQSAVVLLGSAAKHLPSQSAAKKAAIDQLILALNSSSKSVQESVCHCLQPLVKEFAYDMSSLVNLLLDTLLYSIDYSEKRGASYGLAGIVSGCGIVLLKQIGILLTLETAFNDSKNAKARVGVLLAYRAFAFKLGQLFEPYLLKIIPSLLSGFGDSSLDVRNAAQETAKMIMSKLSGHEVKVLLPVLLDGLDDIHWRSKKGSVEMLGAMAHCAPRQLSILLPKIIPRLTEVLTDSHVQVAAAANQSLLEFGEAIKNPEVKTMVPILLKGLSDPNQCTDMALATLLETSFIHYLDSPSLALIMPIVERGLKERNAASKRNASKILVSLGNLTEAADLKPYIHQILPFLQLALFDTVPNTRATAAKALGALVESLGEPCFPNIVNDLLNVLRQDESSVDRQGAAQGIAETVAALGIERLEEILPDVIADTSNSKATVREGFINLLVYLPATFGSKFQPYLSRTIGPILSGIADEHDFVREASLHAAKILIGNYANKAVDLLLPDLEAGFFDSNWRIRQSSVELVATLIFQVSGIKKRFEPTTGEEDESCNVTETQRQALIEVLGQKRRNSILASIFILRQDVSGLVRTSATSVWSSIVNNSPRTVQSLMPMICKIIITNLGSDCEERQQIASRAVEDLARKMGDVLLSKLLPLAADIYLESENLELCGFCRALTHILETANSDQLNSFQDSIVALLPRALCNVSPKVKEVAAETFGAMFTKMGFSVVREIVPYLLTSASKSDSIHRENVKAAIQIITRLRPNAVFPIVLESLTRESIGSLQTDILEQTSKVAGRILDKYIKTIGDTVFESIKMVCGADYAEAHAMRVHLVNIFSRVKTEGGMDAIADLLINKAKSLDLANRREICIIMTCFFPHCEMILVQYADSLIPVLIELSNDKDDQVAVAAWTALQAMTKALSKNQLAKLSEIIRLAVIREGPEGKKLKTLSLNPQAISPYVAIYVSALMSGQGEQREQGAIGIGDMILRTEADYIKPYSTQLVGCLIRVSSERVSSGTKQALLRSLTILLQTVPQLLKPFTPQLTHTFTKNLVTKDEDIRVAAEKAICALLPLLIRFDALVNELTQAVLVTDNNTRTTLLHVLGKTVEIGGTRLNETTQNLLNSLLSDEKLVDDTNELRKILFKSFLS